jgi:hypothetical protein
MLYDKTPRTLTTKELMDGFYFGPFYIWTDGWWDDNEPLIVSISWHDYPDTQYLMKFTRDTEPGVILSKVKDWLREQLQFGLNIL